MTSSILYILVAILSTGSFAALTFAAVKLIKNTKILEETKARLKMLEIDSKEREQDLQTNIRKIEELENYKNSLLIEKTKAETNLEAFKELLQKSENEKDIYKKDKEEATEQRNNFERQCELVNQRIKINEKEMLNWEEVKKKQIEAANASIAEAGAKLSSKLLDDHKREAEQAKKESQKITNEATEQLYKKFNNVSETIGILHDKVKENSKTVGQLHNSLLSPSGAGSLAEITLENIFKESSLIKDIDYKLQYSLENQSNDRLRPDAVVFLPNNNAMIIDSKASKFFLEIQQNKDDDTSPSLQKELESKLKKTMNNHLNDLVSRDYRQAIEDDLEKRYNSTSHVTTLMFLPTETALEKIRTIEPLFIDKAWKKGILPVGPTGLINLLLQSSLLISNDQQEQNSKLIISEVKDLLNNVAKLYESANSIGKKIKSSLTEYDKFAGSFNQRFIPKAKNIEKLGVESPSFKKVSKLDRYNIDSRDYKEIEGETTEKELALEYSE